MDPSLLITCLGFINITCTEAPVVTQLDVAPVHLVTHLPEAVTPSTLTVMRADNSRTTVVLELLNARFAAEPVTVVGRANTVAAGTSVYSASNDGSLLARNFVIDMNFAAIGHPIKAKLRVFDPNLGETLEERALILVDIRGLERFEVPFFNPASNTTQQSFIRLTARGGDTVVTITAIDEEGNRKEPYDKFIFAQRTISINSAALEQVVGSPVGKYRLLVDTDNTGLALQALVRSSISGTVSTVSDVVSSQPPLKQGAL